MDSIKKWVYTISAAIILFSMYFFWKRRILFSTGVSFPLIDANNLRYLLSAEIQSLAAILAIIFAILILGTQMNYQLYSPKFGYKFLSSDYLFYFLVYGMAIVYDLLALLMIPEYENEAIQQNFISSIGNTSILLMILCLVILPTFILSTIKNLLPATVFEDAVDSTSNEKKIPEVREFLFLSIISALGRSDYVAVEDGIKSILKLIRRKKRIIELTETLDDVYIEMEKPFPKKRYLIIIRDFFDKNLEKDYLPIFLTEFHQLNWLRNRDPLWKLMIDELSIKEIEEGGLQEKLFSYSCKTGYKIEMTFEMRIKKKVKEYHKGLSISSFFGECANLFKSTFDSRKGDVIWVKSHVPIFFDIILKHLQPIVQINPVFRKDLKGKLDWLAAQDYFAWENTNEYNSFFEGLVTIFNSYYHDWYYP